MSSAVFIDPHASLSHAKRDRDEDIIHLDFPNLNVTVLRDLRKVSE
ncbi:hypothetical protein M2418_000493 [Rhizobium sp. BIGb0125]|nr:hypothetical protein [Rhizobium sp. BIGb0125]